MLVDELIIPHPDGSVRVRLDGRVTVLAGLDAPARARFADLLASGLAGVGPATVVVRDDQGRPGRIEPGTLPSGPVPTGPGATAEVHRLVVVGPAELGVRHELPTPALAAERTAAAIAHRQLEGEVAAIEAGAAERARLLREIGEEGHDVTDAGPDGCRRPDLDAVAASAARIDELIRRQREAGEVLERTAAVLRSVDDDPTRPPPPAAGDPRLHAGPLATGLLAAIDVVRRVSRATLDETADHRRAEHDARLALARARAEIDRARGEAQAEVDVCHHELATLAAAADVPVGAEGPGAALTSALVTRRHRVAAAAESDPAARLLARRRASLRARMAELPDDADVAAARRQLGAVAAHLARLGGRGGADVELTRQALLGRIALLRPDGTTSIAPLVLDEALVGLEPDDLLDLLDLVVRVAERNQVVLLTGDAAIATWARHRSLGGALRLIELARA